MTKLRFVKAWGPNKPGDIKDTASQATVHWLVDIYKFAVIEPDNPIATALPVSPVADVTAPKAIPKAPRDKMLISPVAAKSGKGHIRGRE